MFRGTFFYSLDDKARLAIPKRYRELLPVDPGDREPQIVVTRSLGSPKTLHVYPVAEWKKLEDRIRAKSQFKKLTQEFKRRYLGPAHELTIDAQGRILIPQNLRDSIALTKEAVITGDLEKFLIWSREMYDRQQDVDDSTADEFSVDDLDL
jgi:MraZ protein